jgi:hypothetical protein
MSDETTNIHELIGEQISGVCFVRDYLEIHFDGPIIRILSNPTIKAGERTLQIPSPGSRDAICGIIGATVKDLKLQENMLLELILDNDCRVLVPLDSINVPGGEAMHYVPGPNLPIVIW